MSTVKENQRSNPFKQLDEVEQLLRCNETETLDQNLLLDQLAAIQELVSRFSQSPSLNIGCKQLADLSAEYLGGNIYVGICRKPSETCQLIAASETQQIDPNQKTLQLASYAMEEAVARKKASSWPCKNPRDGLALKALQQFADSRTSSEARRHFLMVPILDKNQLAKGAILFESHSALTETRITTTLRFLEAAAPLLSSAVGLQVRAEGNRVDQIVRHGKEFCKSQKIKVVAIALATILMMMLIPISYNVHCKCELQPVVRRFVAAPFSGRLENSFFEPGDTVKKGDVLARLDGRDVNWELSGKQAELNQAISVRDGHLAAHRSGEAQIASLEVKRLKLAVDQLKSRAQKLEIQSPISGMIVVGDLTKSEGIVLETGQMLYEIAPLDEMVVELAISESDVRFVKTGMTVSMTLDAFPNRTIEAKVRRIHPRAELKEHENVFIAEMEIANPEQGMRPGMRGTASISTVKKSIGWIILHKAYEAARRLTI